MEPHHQVIPLSYLALRQRTHERHSVYKNVIFLLYSKDTVGGCTVNSWKCKKYRSTGCPVISKYSHDRPLNPLIAHTKTELTLELFTLSLNDLFPHADDDDDEDDEAVDYSDEEDVPVVSSTSIPRVTTRDDPIKPVPQLSPAMFVTQPPEYVPPMYLPFPQRFPFSAWEKMYGVLNVPINLPTANTLFDALDNSITSAMALLSSNYDTFGVSAPYICSWPYVGNYVLARTGDYGSWCAWSTGTGTWCNPFSSTRKCEADAYFLYTEFNAVKNCINGNEKPMSIDAPIVTTLILDVPQDIPHPNVPSFLEATIRAFAFKIAHWARNTQWRVMGIDGDSILYEDNVVMEISPSGQVTVTLNPDMYSFIDFEP